ncbi:MAG: RraA family protein [Chloroflexi bacterium]|nr:RraA family protein [Chloroflexota bacterium]
MVATLTPEQLAELREIDSPTISNAIETFDVRGRFDGYLGPEIQCIFGDMEPMVGYAVTVTIKNVGPGDPIDSERKFDFFDALDAAPKPAVCVFKDISPNPRRASQWGEVLATTTKALGAIGVVTDGTVRDINEVRAIGGFHYFAQGVCVSHGELQMVDVNVPVEISGCTIEPGDLVHGDVNGVILIPNEVADRVAEAAAGIYAQEGKMMEALRQPGLTAEKVREIFSY